MTSATRPPRRGVRKTPALLVALLALASAPVWAQTANDYFAEAANLSKAGLYAGAIEQLRLGLALDPTNGKGHFYLAELYRRGGQTLDAYKHYKQAVPLLSDVALGEQVAARIQELEPQAEPLLQQEQAAEAQKKGTIYLTP